jgi:ATP-dependent helicase/DNAse subunit B
MVPAASWKSPRILEDGFPMFSQKATKVLKRLISADTTFILTSSHRSKHTISEWKNIFAGRGIKIEKLRSLNNNNNNANRKEEILRWFDENNTDEDFVIIDDDKSLNSLPAFLKKHLILTSPLVGLTEEHLLPMENILGKSLQLV